MELTKKVTPIEPLKCKWCNNEAKYELVVRDIRLATQQDLFTNHTMDGCYIRGDMRCRFTLCSNCIPLTL